MTPEELNALADRVERLEGADREVDLRIAVAVLPDWDGLDEKSVGFHVKYGGQPAFTASLDVAMTLSPAESWVRMDEWPGGFGAIHATVHPIRDPAIDGGSAKGSTLAIALCAAALRARAALASENSNAE